jgi:hypothetical protein
MQRTGFATPAELKVQMERVLGLSDTKRSLENYQKALRGETSLNAVTASGDLAAAQRDENFTMTDQEKAGLIHELKSKASLGKFLMQQENIGPVSAARQAVIKEELGEIKRKKERAEHLVMSVSIPRGFYQEQARRTLVAEESKKIQTHNWEELVQYFKEAQHHGDKYKMSAILHQLANDYNDNEITNAMGYHSGFEGYKQFFQKEVKEKGGFSEQEMLALASDVSAVNESRNHWDTARTVTVDQKTGLRRWKTEPEHVIEALAEIRKFTPRRVAQEFNRLAYGGERPQPDGTRKFELGPLGLGILNTISSQLGGFIERNEMNPNAAANLTTALQQFTHLPYQLETAAEKFRVYTKGAPLDLDALYAETKRQLRGG